MCNKCNNNNRANESFAQAQTRFMREIKGYNAHTVENVKIDDNVTLHLLSGSEHHKSTVATVLKMVQENYPAPGKVDVYFPANFSDDDPGTQGTTLRAHDGIVDNVGDDRVVVISAHAFTTKISPSWFHAPSYKDVSEGAYVIIHEWGHVQDKRDVFTNPLADIRMNTYSGMVTMQNIVTSLGEYGLSDEREAYAESWLEWVVTNGQTTNYAAKWYANKYNWPVLPRKVLFPPRRNFHTSPDEYRQLEYVGYQNHGW